MPSEYEALVAALKLTDIPFSEYAWKTRPEGTYGVISLIVYFLLLFFFRCFDANVQNSITETAEQVISAIGVADTGP